MAKKTAEKKPATMAGLPVLEHKEPPQPEGMTVVELFVENIKKVRLCHVKPKGDVVLVTGDNGSGKSSVLDALMWAVDGLGTTTTEPIRRGQRVGAIKVDLGDYVIKRYFTRVDPEKSEKGKTYFPKLIVEGKNNEVFKNPQTLLNSFMGSISFDPLAFTRMEDKAQLEELRRLVKFDLDIDALDAAQKADYDSRKLVGRDVDAAKARLEGAMVPAEGLPTVAIDTAAITAQLEGAANHNNIVESQKRRKQQFLEEAHDARMRAVQYREEAQRQLGLANLLDGQIASISIVPAPTDSIDAVTIAMRDSEAITVGEPIDTQALFAQLSDAMAMNNAIADAAGYRKLQAEHEKAEAAWTALDTAIKERAETRAAAMARAAMPLEGLGIGDGEVLYEGLPFSQASNAAQIRVSMALGMASNPKLRIMIIKDGSLLGDKAMALIEEMAAKNGFQVWIERVDTSGKVGVVMEDGDASGEEVVGR